MGHPTGRRQLAAIHRHLPQGAILLKSATRCVHLPPQANFPDALREVVLSDAINVGVEFDVLNREAFPSPIELLAEFHAFEFRPI